MEPKFKEPGWFTRKVFNPLVGWLSRHGVSVAGSRVLEVQGRKSGEWRRTPVNPLPFEGDLYLVAPRGNTQWVRNMRASGGGRLVGRRTEEFTATELEDSEKPPLLRAYLKKWKWEVGAFFDGVDADAPEEELHRRREAGLPDLRLSMGTELHHEVSGSGDPLLLVHGNGANTRIWGRSIEDLAATHRVIAYDRRGFGRSPGPPAKNMRQHVSDAAALLEELDAAPATVLGWSGGGVVAAGLAIERPELVSSLILEEAGIHLPLNNTFNLLRSGVKIEFARRLRRDERRAALEVFEFALAYRDGGNQFDRFPEDWRESMLDAAEATVAETDHLRQPYPRRADLAGISCPVTMLQGSRSEPTFAKVNRYLTRRIRSAEVVEIEGTAHAVHFDRPEEFRDAVLAAAAKSGSQSAAAAE